MITDALNRGSPPSCEDGSDSCRAIRQQHFGPLLQRLGWPAGEASARLRTLGVTGSTAGEGVSTVAAQLAAAAASSGGGEVLLVDANFARPSVQRTLGVNLGPGLTDLLVGDEHLVKAFQSSRVADVFSLRGGQLWATFQPTPVAGLFALAAGRSSIRPARSYYWADLVQVIDTVQKLFDLVVVDMPSVDRLSSTLQLAGSLDGVLLVVAADRVRWSVAQRTTDLLSEVNARLLGAILNGR